MHRRWKLNVGENEQHFQNINLSDRQGAKLIKNEGGFGCAHKSPAHTNDTSIDSYIWTIVMILENGTFFLRTFLFIKRIFGDEKICYAKISENWSFIWRQLIEISQFTLESKAWTQSWRECLRESTKANHASF